MTNNKNLRGFIEMHITVPEERELYTSYVYNEHCRRTVWREREVGDTHPFPAAVNTAVGALLALHTWETHVEGGDALERALRSKELLEEPLDLRGGDVIKNTALPALGR